MSVERVADASWFVILVYFVAFAPWVYYGVVDHVDGRWQEVNKLKNSTKNAMIWFLVSLVLLQIYIVFQIIASDWKETMAAIVVLGGTGFPLQRVLRQCWILSSNARLERFLSPFGKWNPSNSNKFFDNDSPGEGVGDISLMEWWNGSQCPVRPRRWYRNRDVRARVSRDPISWPEPDVERWSDDTWPHLYQSMKMSFERTTVETSIKYELRILANANANGGKDDIITRTLWLFENLPGRCYRGDQDGGRTMSNIVRVGLAAHVCHMFCNGKPNFPWLDYLGLSPVLPRGGIDPEPDGTDAMDGNFQNSEETLTRELQEHARCLLAQKKSDAAVFKFRTGGVGSLPFGVLNISSGQMLEVLDEDFSEVYQKLPVSRRSTRACGHILWQHVMQMISIILEVAFVVETLLGWVDCKGEDLLFSAVTKHAVCYAAGNFISCPFNTREEFKMRMALLQESWLDDELRIAAYCNEVAESLARAMAKQEYNYLPESVAHLKCALGELEERFKRLRPQEPSHTAQASTSADTRFTPPADAAVPTAVHGREDV